MTEAPNPFAALSLFVAPSILTNACSVPIMSPSNRLARTVDRARELSRELEARETLAVLQERAAAAKHVMNAMHRAQ